MEVKAKAKFIRMSPRKVRLVAGIVRGMEARKALDQLQFANKLAAKPIIKLINSAIANAVNNFELDKSNLFVKEITIDEGPTLKRWMPKARGRATPIRKKTSHINLLLAELVESGKKAAKAQKIEAPIKLGSKPKEDEGIKIKEKDEKKAISEEKDEKGKIISDPRMEGKDRRGRIEGSTNSGFVKKMFRRKSG